MYMSEFNLNHSMKSYDSAPIKQTNYVRIRDNNNGSYSGNQFSLTTDSLTSSNDFYDLKDSLLEIPFKITIDTVQDLTKSQFLLSLKHGYYSKINGISVKLDNQPLVNFTQLSNLYTHFNVLTSFSSNDMDLIGDLIGFHKDSSASYSYTTTDNLKGIGECSNGLNYDPSYNVVSEYFQPNGNPGFLQKSSMLSYDEADPVLSTFVKTGRAKEIFKSYKTDDGVDTVTFNICAVVRLADIHDVFKQMPIMRNPNLNIVCQVHNCNATITTDVTNLYTTGFSVNPVHNFCGWQLRTNTSTDISGNCTITESMKNESKSIVELVIPRVTFNEEDELDYIESMGREKLVKYTDIHSATTLESGASVNWMANSALSGMTGVVLLTRLGSNGTALNGNSAALVSVDNSPWTSAPNYLCSAQAIANFQVYLSNRPVFESPITYNYDMYLEMMRSKCVNNFSGASYETGLITRRDWEEGNYGYIYVKLPESENKTADQSLQIRFTNDNSAKIKNLDLLCFIEVEKAYNVDVNTGKIKIVY